ncbi:disease resistance protein At4g27190-like [Magnolia sinica]|uniref:disease resistance protein At4g27190-like n=1 Tax=Magnolia sinica TaxID=86752 RepID=UPI00265A68D0|nr:disease resistance protein At4g27190-like [Magnolia sinica]
MDETFKTRGIPLASKCACCVGNPLIRPACESLQHLFLQSNLAGIVWGHFQSIFRLPSLPSLSVQHWLRLWWHFEPSSGLLHIIGGLVPCIILWEIWISRNASKYEGIPPLAARIIARVTWRLSSSSSLTHATSVQLAANFLAFRDRGNVDSFTPRAHLELVKWRRRKCSWVKLNVDGLFPRSVMMVFEWVREERAGMASRRGSDLPTFEGRLNNYPVGVKRAGEKLFNCFKNPKIGVIGVKGFYGVGGWSIVEYAAQKAKDSHLFDVQILVKVLERDFSLTKVQMEIAFQLGLTTAGSTEDEMTLKFLEVRHEIYDLLRGRRFLLMIGNVSEGPIDMESLGVPFRRSRTYDSKVVYVGRWDDDNMSNVAIKLEESSIDVLREEATNVAHSLNVKGCYAPDTVLNCFFYLMLFREEGCEVEWLTRYWMAEGFITRGGMEEDDDWRLQQKKVEALLRELEDHFMAYCRSNKWGLSSRIRMASRDLKSSSTHDRFWSESPLPIEICEWENIHRMNVLVWEEETYLPPLAPNCPKLSTLIFTVISCSGGQKIIIPDPFFEQMQGLRVLVLYQLDNKFLPPSISCLHNLRLLIIEGWENLESLPSSFQALHKLEFLEVSKSHSLESIPYEFFIQMNNLQLPSLNGKKIRSLPSSVSKLCTLHELKLTSSDSLMELPDESFESNCYSLKIKLLPHLQKLTALEELILCNCNSLEDIEDVSSSLGNILPKLHMLDLSGIKAFQRLSLRGTSSPNGINGVLNHTELFTLCDNAFVRRLSDLGNVKRMTELKECRVEKCKQMEKFFEGENASSDTLSLLENVWISYLARLKSICEGTYGSRSFAGLKHIHLDCCPRLVTVFSSSVSLQSLEKLEIRFCSRLEAVFREDDTVQGSLQRLHTVCLWELPKLESICHGTYLSALKNLKVRGCRKLKKLPLCVEDNASGSTSIGGGDGSAKVEGELKWWNSLKWEKESIKHHIHFKESRPFTRR